MLCFVWGFTYCPLDGSSKLIRSRLGSAWTCQPFDGLFARNAESCARLKKIALLYARCHYAIYLSACERGADVLEIYDDPRVKSHRAAAAPFRNLLTCDNYGYFQRYKTHSHKITWKNARIFPHTQNGVIRNTFKVGCTFVICLCKWYGYQCSTLMCQC